MGTSTPAGRDGTIRETYTTGITRNRKERSLFYIAEHCRFFFWD